MGKLRGLGRGLDALLGPMEASAPEALIRLKLEQIRPGKFQPRARMDPESLSELAESIKSRGVVQPLLVRPVNPGQYEIIAGERRWRAAKMAGLSEVPGLVREVPDEAALAIALIENIQREDLNPLEEASGLARLINDFGMTHEDAAQAIGRSRSAVTNLLRLLTLALPVRELLLKGEIEMGHARALLALDGAKQIELAQLAAARALSVREVERQVKRLQAPATVSSGRRDPDLLRLEEKFAEKLGASVSIKSGKNRRSGKLVIAYTSLDHLDSILERMG
ncbi:MAG TPA: ParB/RepB/Spo0J family partition protein [Burkholderiales bacterium]|nr:ParB/RepB/Spo0J family partition protein [Burkholderiales bacterium]